MEAETEFNPYAPPQAQRIVDETSPEGIRRAHIRHEREIKSVGGLYVLVGGLMLIPLVLGMGDVAAGRKVSVWLVFVLIAAGALALGAGLRRLAPWARIPVAVVSVVLTVLTVPTIIGPALNILAVWLMLSRKGRRVMSREYQSIVDLTPDVRPESTGIGVVGVVLLLLFALFVGSIVMALLAPVLTHHQ